MKILHREILFLNIVGLWSPTNLSGATKYLFYLYTFTGVSGHCLTMSGQTIYLITCTSLMELINGITFYLTELSFMIKVLLCVTKKKRFEKLMQELTVEEYCPKNSEEEDIRKEHDIFSKYVIYGRKMFFF